MLGAEQKSYQFLYAHLQQSQRLSLIFIAIITLIALNYPGEDAWTLAVIQVLFSFLLGIATLMLALGRIQRLESGSRDKLARLRLLAFWQAVISITSITLGIHVSGGPASPITFIYFIYVGAISSYYPRRQVIFLNFFIIASYLTLLYGYESGLYAPHFVVDTPFNQIALQNIPFLRLVVSLSLFANAVVIAAHASQTQASLQDADAQNLYLNRLHQLASAGLENKDLHGIYQTLAQQIRLILSAETVYLTRWDEASRQVFPGAAAGKVNEEYQILFPSNPQEMTLTKAALYAQTARIASNSLCTPYLAPRIAQAFPPCAMLSVPMYSLDNQFMGAILIAHAPHHRFTAYELRQATQLTGIAALLLSRTKLYEETQRRAALLEQLAAQVTELTSNLRRTALLPAIIESARRLMNARHAALHLYTPEGNLRSEYVLGISEEQSHALASRFAEMMQSHPREEQSYLLVPDTHRDERTTPLSGLPFQENFRAYALFSLQAPTGSLGILSLYWEQPHAITSQEITVGSLFARRAGMLLHNAALYEQATEESVTDALTGLPNRRFLNYHLQQDLSANGRTFALLMIDLDGFKAINDTFGHLIGDSVLQQISTTIQSITRPSDVVVRYGGDEFAIILPETDERQAIQTAERIRAALLGTKLHLPHETQRHLSACIGIAVYPLDSTQSNLLLDVADQRMYTAKRMGSGSIVARPPKKI